MFACLFTDEKTELNVAGYERQAIAVGVQNLVFGPLPEKVTIRRWGFAFDETSVASKTFPFEEMLESGFVLNDGDTLTVHLEVHLDGETLIFNPPKTIRQRVREVRERERNSGGH